MRNVKNRAAIIRTASLTALAGNTLLAALKIGAGMYAGSLAVTGDGIDSSIDVLIAIMTLIVGRVISRPADKEHPWGHGRAETVATAILSCILFFAGAQLVLSSLGNLFSPAKPEAPQPLALIAALISIVGKSLLSWSQYYFGNKASSAMLKANAKNMTGDVILSLGVLAGTGLSIWLDRGIIDSAAAVIVGFWVIKSAVGIFIGVNTELMDGSDTGLYGEVFAAVHSVEGAGNPHRTRMRHIAGLWDIDIDIEVNPELSVREAHRIASRVEQAIKDRVEDVYDIMVHVEPAGESGRHDGEGYGLSEKEMENGPEAADAADGKNTTE
ncbi:MAG: cation diffusion facilitator family transporter [Treponema sp.]|jgi:cation diffusion facilitator family transporter|nr:cation diffusion facilitator family transporter [Treponema sp.]